MMLSWDRLLAALATVLPMSTGDAPAKMCNKLWAATLDTTEDMVENKIAMTDTNIVGLVFLLVSRL